MNSITYAKARAFANIALIKYWGKRDDDKNIPATPSISLAIDSLKTETTVNRADNEVVVINDVDVTPIAFGKRVRGVLDSWREEKLLEGFFHIESSNNFPTRAGLASSASGMAALTRALGCFAEKELELSELSRLARKASGSAARSITGGLSILPTEGDPVARQIIQPEEIPWGMVTAVTDLDSKKVNSREAMKLSRLTSPYYANWLVLAAKDYEIMLKALEKMDFTKIGEITERNCLAMHACMLASSPPLLYWNSATMAVMHAVKEWRDQNLEGYFTIDAGPQVCIIARREDLSKIAEKVQQINGVRQVLIGLPAGGAEILECR